MDTEIYFVSDNGTLYNDATYASSYVMTRANRKLEALGAKFIISHLHVYEFHPHPYMITQRHVDYANKSNRNVMSEVTIYTAEYLGIGCGSPGCILPFGLHTREFEAHIVLLEKDTEKNVRSLLSRARGVLLEEHISRIKFLNPENIIIDGDWDAAVLDNPSDVSGLELPGN